VLKSKNISSIKVNETFVDCSFEYNYDPSDYVENLSELISIWQNNGVIEIYETIQTRSYGKIKSSEIDGKEHFV